jgi:hypothetical protein
MIQSDIDSEARIVLIVLGAAVLGIVAVARSGRKLLAGILAAGLVLVVMSLWTVRMETVVDRQAWPEPDETAVQPPGTAEVSSGRHTAGDESPAPPTAGDESPAPPTAGDENPAPPPERPAPASPPLAPPPPLPEPRSYGRTLSAPDDYRAWERGNALSFTPVPSGKEWVLNAAGSTPVRDRLWSFDLILWDPGADGAVVGYSGLAASPEDARRAARNAAVEKLGLLALRDVGRDGRRRYLSSTHTLHVLKGLAVVTAGAGIQIADEDVFLQTAEKPYGRIYRAAVRVPVDAARIKVLADVMRKKIDEGWLREQAWRRELLSMLGLLLTLLVGFFAAYCLSTAGARGAAAWPLRIGAAGVLVLAGFAVYAVVAG